MLIDSPLDSLMLLIFANRAASMATNFVGQSRHKMEQLARKASSSISYATTKNLHASMHMLMPSQAYISLGFLACSRTGSQVQPLQAVTFTRATQAFTQIATQAFTDISWLAHISEPHMAGFHKRMHMKHGLHKYNAACNTILITFQT